MCTSIPYFNLKWLYCSNFIFLGFVSKTKLTEQLWNKSWTHGPGWSCSSCWTEDLFPKSTDAFQQAKRPTYTIAMPKRDRIKPSKSTRPQSSFSKTETNMSPESSDSDPDMARKILEKWSALGRKRKWEIWPVFTMRAFHVPNLHCSGIYFQGIFVALILREINFGDRI